MYVLSSAQFSLYFIIYMQERDGWYTTSHFERIKAVLRHKFFSLLEGYIPSEEECHALLVPVSEGSNKVQGSGTRKLRPGKHNMAKGALRPEDAAVSHSLGLGLFRTGY
jgi:general transcription factor 3C polypeptide 5 (transcription factor C subunit 1)